MKRKTFLKSGLVAAASGAALLSGCTADGNSTQSGNSAAAQNTNTGKTYNWKMVTTWPPNFPVLGEAANLLAKWVKTMSNGRLNIKVYGGGELVPPLEAFGTVSDGTAEMGSGASYYWVGKSPAAQFFASVPFGMNAQQLTSWMLAGGGYDLWKEIYAKFNLVPFLGGNTGVQMGGWFNREINSVEDLKGLKMRIPGIAGKVLEKAGGAAVLLPGGEIYTSLERGVIDACEWIGPYHDYKMGFHKIAKYYYTPGWHEPGTQLEFFVNKGAHDKLPKDLQEILYTASLRSQAWMLAEFDMQNSLFLDKLEEEGKVQIKQFPKPVLRQLKKYTDEAIQELVGSDPLAKKVFESFNQYIKRVSKWTNLTEKAFYNELQF